MAWLERLPLWIRISFIAVGILLGAFGNRLPEGYQDAGLALAALLLLAGFIGTGLHILKERRGGDKVEATDLIRLGSIGTVTFIVIALAGFIWRTTASSDNATPTKSQPLTDKSKTALPEPAPIAVSSALAAALGTLQYQTAALSLELSVSKKSGRGQILLQVINQNDFLVEYDATLRATINGVDLDKPTIVHGIIGPRDTRRLATDYINQIQVNVHPTKDKPAILAVFAYDIDYWSPESPERKRHTGKTCVFSTWLVPQGKLGEETKLELPIVKFDRETEQ